MTKPGIYKHWKTGNLYRVLFNARVSTNGAREGRLDVVYMDLKHGGIHTRDEGEWNQRVWLPANSFSHEPGDTVTDWNELPNGVRFVQTAERFTFVGTMGNEMSDKVAEELYDGLHETFTGRVPQEDIKRSDPSEKTEKLVRRVTGLEEIVEMCLDRATPDDHRDIMNKLDALDK